MWRFHDSLIRGSLDGFQTSSQKGDGFCATAEKHVLADPQSRRNGAVNCTALAYCMQFMRIIFYSVCSKDCPLLREIIKNLLNIKIKYLNMMVYNLIFLTRTAQKCMEFIKGIHMAKTQRADEAYTELRSQIVRRCLPPGTRLSELSLSKRLDLSRTPIREAMRRLQAEGFVVFFPSRGFVVNSLSLDDINQIYTIRIPLEGIAGRLATPNLSGEPERMACLEELNSKMKELCQQGDAEAYADKNKEFHGIIFRACGNPWLINILENLTLQIGRFIVNAVHIPGRMELSLLGHSIIIEKLKGADAIGVERELAKHCRKASEDLMMEFKRIGETGPLGYWSR